MRLASLFVAGALALAAPAAANPLIAGQGEGEAISAEQTLTRIGFGSCLRQDRPAAILGAIAQQNFDLFIFAGDNVYGDTVAGDESDPELNATISAYAGLAARPDWQRFRTAQPLLAIWDDHDLGENDGGAAFPYRAGTQQLFLDFWGKSAGAPQRHGDGLYGAYMFGPEGRRVQVILLDTRSFRSALAQSEPDANNRRAYVPVTDPAATMLGAAQWAWLEGELRKPADVRLIVSSIQVAALDHPFEKWANIPAERQKLFDLIASTRANGVIFLSGDRHRALVSRETEGTPYPLTDFTSSSLNIPFPARGVETDRTSLGAYFEQANFGEVAIDWEGRSVALILRGPDGADVRRETLPLADLAVRQ